MPDYPPYDPFTQKKKPPVNPVQVVKNILWAFVALASVGYGTWRLVEAPPKIDPTASPLPAPAIRSSELAENIHQGMTPADVKVAIGEPQRVTKIDGDPTNTERWYYNANRFEVDFQNGFVTQKLTTP